MAEKEITDDIEFEDAETFKAGGTTFKDIVLNQFRKCTLEGSKEMTTGGGIITRRIGDTTVEYPAPNQVEIYINSVETFKIILTKKIEKNWKILGDRMDIFNRIRGELNNERIEKEREYLNKFKNVSILPRDEQLKIEKKTNAILNDLRNEYDRKAVQNYKYLFETLVILMDHLKYFEEEAVMR